MEQNGRVVRSKNDQGQARPLYVGSDLIRPNLSSSNPTALATWSTPKVFPVKWPSHLSWVSFLDIYFLEFFSGLIGIWESSGGLCRTMMGLFDLFSNLWFGFRQHFSTSAICFACTCLDPNPTTYIHNQSLSIQGQSESLRFFWNEKSTKNVFFLQMISKSPEIQKKSILSCIV